MIDEKLNIDGVRILFVIFQVTSIVYDGFK